MTAALTFSGHVAYPLAAKSPAIDAPFAGRAVFAGSSSYSDYRRATMFENLDRAIYVESQVDPDPCAVLHAREFLGQLPVETPVPDVVVEEDGAVAFDWESAPRRSFSVSVSSDGRLRYGGLFGYDMHSGTLYPSGTLPRTLLTFISRTRDDG